MASFKVPAPVRKVPAELKPEIDASVRRFEEQWGLMLAFAKQNGYIENYRKEVTAVALKAYDTGREVR